VGKPKNEAFELAKKFKIKVDPGDKDKGGREFENIEDETGETDAQKA